MQVRHSVHDMQMSQGPSRPLLTALEVQELLHIDRSTVYRMAEDGRLPAIRVGRSWRFPADRIEALLDSGQADGATDSTSAAAAGTTGSPALSLVTANTLVPANTLATEPDEATADAADPSLNTDAASTAVEVAAELLGVMMVVTDMHGRPVTDVANQCSWFAARSDSPTCSTPASPSGATSPTTRTSHPDSRRAPWGSSARARSSATAAPWSGWSWPAA